MLNNIWHGIQILAWQNTEDAQKKGGKKHIPKPFIPDFMKKETDNQQSMDIDELKDFLNRKRAS